MIKAKTLGAVPASMLLAGALTSTCWLSLLAGCAYDEPAIGVLVHIRNPQEHSFDLTIDGKHAGKLEKHSYRLIRIEPEEVKIKAKNVLFIPAIVVWHSNIKRAYWNVDATRFRELVEARRAGTKPMPSTPEAADVNLVLDKYFTSKRTRIFFVY